MDLRQALQDAIEERRPYVLVTIVGREMEILFGGDPDCPPTWADVARLLAYAAQCAEENAEEDHEIFGQDRERDAPPDRG